MKILDLPLKAVWYMMIESGEKTEEYRELKPYWYRRLCFFGTNGGFCDLCKLNSCCTNEEEKYTHVRFRYDYTKRTMLFKLDSISIGKGNPEWGAPDYDVFILKLGQRIE